MAGVDGSFSESTRLAIRYRAEQRCEICALRIVSGAQYHHRKPRRMGGTSDPATGSPANGMYLHPGCHRKVEENRLRSMGYGWLLSSVDDPEEVPLIVMGRWVLLTGDGRAVPVPGPAARQVPSPAPDRDAHGHGTA